MPNTKAAKPKGVVKDSEFFATIGKKGGMATKRRKLQENPNYYADIGLKGGNAMKETRGKEFYSMIGRMGKRNNDENEQEQDPKTNQE
jgi:general stress protein YciG